MWMRKVCTNDRGSPVNRSHAPDGVATVPALCHTAQVFDFLLCSLVRRLHRNHLWCTQSVWSAMSMFACRAQRCKASSRMRRLYDSLWSRYAVVQTTRMRMRMRMMTRCSR